MRSRLPALVLRLAVLLAGVVALPGAAWAQAWDETDCVEIDIKEIESNRDKRVKFNAKVNVITGNDIVPLQNDTFTLHLNDKAVREGKIVPEDFHDRDNIRVFGYLPAGTGRIFQVLNIVKRGDDAALYKQRINELLAANDMAGLYKLGEEIRQQGERLRQQQAYNVLANQALRAGIALKEKNANPADPTVWVSLAEDYLAYLGDRQGALERLVKSLSPSDPPSAAQRSMLERLQAVVYRGKYVLYEEMKRAEGFVERESGKWILKERAEFEEAIEQQRRERKNYRTKQTEEFFAYAAKSHTIELGMKKSEVAQAIGFPDTVDRVRLGSATYDSWRYEGRGTFYFEEGILFRRPDQPR